MDMLTFRLEAAAATVAPIDAGVPVPDPAPECAERNVQAAMMHGGEPAYNGVMQAVGASGVTLILVTLADDGTMLDTAVFKPAGAPGLDDSALKAAKASAFAPAVSDCRKIGGLYLFVVHFGAP